MVPVPEKLFKAVVVAHVVDMVVEVVETVGVEYQFTMKMVPLLVGLSLETLLLDQQQLCYLWLDFFCTTLLARW